MQNNPLDDGPVELVHWPRDRTRREALAKAGIPRLLLVAGDAAPPSRIEPGEDWLRVPASERDVVARARHVVAQVSRLRSEPAVLEREGVLRRADAKVVLSVAEARVTHLLLQAAGTVVSRAIIERELWPDGVQSRRALDALISRLRRRIAPLGISILVARGRGFTLDHGAASPTPPPTPSVRS